MSSPIQKIDNIIKTIDDNLASDQKQNDDNNNNNNATSSTPATTGIKVLGMGNPLLDISSPVDDAFMKKYDIKAGTAILADDKHLPMYQELASMATVEYIGGGSTLNSMRVCQWMSQIKDTAGYSGCIGKDKFGSLLEKCTSDAGVTACFMKDDTTATGVCAVCVTNKERSLITNLLAANNFKIDHCNTIKSKAMIASSSIIYSAGFFVTVSPDTMLMVAKECKKSNKLYCINFSAEFIVTVFKDKLLTILPYASYIFSNETEAKAFATANNINYTDMKDLAIKISKLASELSKQRIVIITQGCDPVIVATGDAVNEYPVKKIAKNNIVDTNGAGDAFVGGFLSQLVLNKNEATCVAAGTYAAQYILKRAGTKLQGKPAFKPN